VPPQASGSCSVTLAQELTAPAAARRELDSWLAAIPGARVQQDALIAVNELVANAVRFGRPPIRVKASLTDEILVVEVSDEGSDRPRRRVPAEDGGVGLNLVYLLADRVEIADDRSHVRCEFDLLQAPA
jgi:anti-sigma regulatory factor (Ser/Thr protein kinase)